jgi:hypothetical protein
VGEGRGCEELRLEDLVVENSALRRLVGSLTSRNVAEGERASDALECWLSARTGRAYVLDREDAESMGRACLCAALDSECREEYVKAVLALPAEQQTQLYGLVEENELWQLRAVVTRREREMAALKKHVRALELGSAHLENTQRETSRRLEAVERSAVAAAATAAARLAEAEVRASRAEDELHAMADELDVARGKAAQLVKVEVKLVRLMQRLEETAALRSRLDSLPDNSARELERKLGEAEELEALRAELGESRRRTAEAEAAAARARAELEAGAGGLKDEGPPWWEALLQGCGAARQPRP